MSMPGWLNDAAPALQNDNGLFNNSLDQSTAFMQPPASSAFDLNQLQNQPQQPRMQNGTSRNGSSPAFYNPVYQTHSVIPSKRPRALEDNMGASPRQMPGALPNSRSQTPQQSPYHGFPPNNATSGQQLQPPTSYQHLQHGGSTTGSPSPVMQNQHFNTPGMPQRMQTGSASPFSPTAQNFVTQASPPLSDHGSQVNTPQNGSTTYTQSMTYGNGPNQQFAPQPGTMNASQQGLGASQFSSLPQATQQQQQQQQHQQQQQRMILQARQQQSMQQNQANIQAAHHQYRPSGLNPSIQQQSQNQIAARNLSMQRHPNPKQWFDGLRKFMHDRGLPLDPSPLIAGRLVNIGQLYLNVVKLGGSRRVTESNAWSGIAGLLNFSVAQFPTAPEELRDYWQRNCSAYENVLMQMQQQQQIQQMQQRQRAMADQMQSLQNVQSAESAAHGHTSPDKQGSVHLQYPNVQQYPQIQARSRAEYHTPLKHEVPRAMPPGHLQQNGYLTHEQGLLQRRQSNPYSSQHPSQPQTQQTMIPQQQQQPPPYPANQASSKKERHSGALGANASHHVNTNVGPRIIPMDSIYKPLVRELDVSERTNALTRPYGGIQLPDDLPSFRSPKSPKTIPNLVDEIANCKSDLPGDFELGTIDIRALTMSLRSGINAEVRHALDTLASLTVVKEKTTIKERRFQLQLQECDDLIDTLIDCAEEQVEILADNAAEVSDVMLISSYEEVVRGCRSELVMMQDVFEFGTPDYDLDRRVERLLCITTILRNLSFEEANHSILADASVIKFMATVIRHLGTRNMLLRNNRNTLGITKDMVIYFSNVSHDIGLPGKEEALCILHFLLSFAPCPPPLTPGNPDIMFSAFEPPIHRYLPPAVDSLAKLLARDDPNRAFYKAIFAADNTSSPSFDLLTRSFALAIAPVPISDKFNLSDTIHIRQPYLAQGLLAAEILTSLIPNFEHSLASTWLASCDGFAKNLLRLVSHLSTNPRYHQRNAATGGLMEPEWNHVVDIINRCGMAVLRKLAEKSKDSEVPFVGAHPRLDNVAKILEISLDPFVIRQLCAYAKLTV